MTDVEQNVRRGTIGETDRTTDERLPLAAPAVSDQTIRVVLGEGCYRCSDVDVQALRSLADEALYGRYQGTSGVALGQLLQQMLGRHAQRGRRVMDVRQVTCPDCLAGIAHLFGPQHGEMVHMTQLTLEAYVAGMQKGASDADRRPGREGRAGAQAEA